MAQEPYRTQDMQLERNEMFALGAAAGAIVTAAISEYLERRKPKTRWEKAQARGAEALDAITSTTKAGSKHAKNYAVAANEYVQDVIDTAPKTWQQTKKNVQKRSKKSRKQAFGLKETAVAALGVSAATGLVDKVRDAASSAAERTIGDPYAVSGSITETLKERYDSLRGANNDSIVERAREASGSVLDTLKGAAASATETIKDAQITDKARAASATTSAALLDYATSARDTLQDAKLAEKAKDYSATVAETVKDYAASARDTLQDAKLGEKVKDYTVTVADTVKDYAATARDTLQDAQVGEKAKDYATVAGAALATYSTTAAHVTRKAAQQSATKLSDSASVIAESTSERASDLRKSARKSAKRTRRRATWGFRSFVIGLAVGLLAAPQNGQRTRESLTSFVESILDVLMPDDQSRQ